MRVWKGGVHAGGILGGVVAKLPSSQLPWSSFLRRSPRERYHNPYFTENEWGFQKLKNLLWVAEFVNRQLGFEPESVDFSGMVLALLWNEWVRLRLLKIFPLKWYTYNVATDTSKSNWHLVATDTSKSRCSGYFLSTQGIKYELWHKNWEGQVDLFAACPLSFRESISWFSSCWQVSSQDTKCKCLKAQKSLPGEDKGWTLRLLGGKAQVDSPPPPQLLPWKGVETLLETDSPAGFRLIEAIALASQTCTLHPVASLQCYLSCEWSLGRQQTVSQLACFCSPSSWFLPLLEHS